MNKSIQYLALLALCMLILAAPTCEEDDSSRKTEQLEREKLQAVTEDFSSGSLTSRNLQAFEYRAAEKLMDYTDYLNIVYNQDLDGTFRSHANENIRDLFTGRSAPENPLPSGTDPRSYSSIELLVNSIEIITPLEKQVTETYRGSLQYRVKITGTAGSDTLILHSSINRMVMQLQMTLKDFGGNSLLVWEVLLHDEK